jgi:sulfur-carrier protein
VSVVRVPTVLRGAVGGKATVEATGATIGEVFHGLVEQYPDLRAQVLQEDGSLHRHLNVFLNDDDIRYLGKLDAKVGADDEITLMPAVAGGAVELTAADDEIMLMPAVAGGAVGITAAGGAVGVTAASGAVDAAMVGATVVGATAAGV